MTTAVRGHRLHARRLRNQIELHRDHPDPEAVRARMHDTLERTLPTALAGMLQQRFAHADDSIWLIRRLEVDLTVNVAWDPDRVARCCANSIALALTRALDGGGDRSEVIRFDQPAAFRAAFLTDLLDGCAWGRWYFDSFAGLRKLSTSAAARTLIAENAALGLQTLLALPAPTRTRFIQSLTLMDARRVLHVLASSSAGQENDQTVAIAALTALLAEPPLTEAPRAELALFLHACAAHPARAGRTLEQAVRALVALIHALDNASPVRIELLGRALMTANLVALRTLLRAEPIEALLPLLSWPRERVEQAVAVLAQAQTSARQYSSDAPARATRFGGAFVLLPFLARMPLENATEGWPTLGDIPTAALARFCILIRCFGRAAAPAAFHDAVLRDVTGVPAGLNLGQCLVWLKQVKPGRVRRFDRVVSEWYAEQRIGSDGGDERAHKDSAFLTWPRTYGPRAVSRAFGTAAEMLMRSFAWCLPGFAASSLPHIHTNFLTMGATLEEQPARHVVHLGRPPLGLILDLCGASRQSYRLPWQDQRPFVLFPANSI